MAHQKVNLNILYIHTSTDNMFVCFDNDRLESGSESVK